MSLGKRVISRLNYHLPSDMGIEQNDVGIEQVFPIFFKVNQPNH